MNLGHPRECHVRAYQMPIRALTLRFRAIAALRLGMEHIHVGFRLRVSRLEGPLWILYLRQLTIIYGISISAMPPVYTYMH